MGIVSRESLLGAQVEELAGTTPNSQVNGIQNSILAWRGEVQWIEDRAVVPI